MIASLEPVVQVPIAFVECGAFHRDASIEMQRVWMLTIIGYSSSSQRFLLTFSCINLSASGGMKVCTNEARLSKGVPSSDSWS